MSRPLPDLFSDPHDERRVADAWETFQNGERVPTGALRSPVGGSWLRCAAAQVDPLLRSGPAPLSDQALYLLRERRRVLLEASAPVLAAARDCLSEVGTMMILGDADGTLLCAEGDAPTLELAATIRLMPGARWSESTCGTNAIGTALAIGQPVQIHSAEHFCAGIKRWTCAAAVLRHPSDNQVMGVIDLSGLSATFTRQSVALVLNTARGIESRLMAILMERRLRLLDRAMRSWPAAGRDAAVLYDDRGCPVKASAQAQLAVADAGGGLSFAALPGVPGLAVSGADSARRGDLPPWIAAERLEPMVVDGEQLGTLLVLPRSPRRRGPAVGRATAPAPAGAADPAFAGILTADPGMREVIARASLLARSRAPVLLHGDTGAGKEEFARGLHGQRAGAFVALNCGGLSRELLGSELFGYAEGAFTGARKGGMTGKIEAAHGGTLFLDELAELPLDMQPQLLRVLENGEVCRLGENIPRRVDFRLVAATHRDLRAEIAARRFRQDLFYRIAVTHLRIPPLRERGGDILLLARHFLARFRREQAQPVEALSPEVCAALLDWPWPGNVRELRNVIEGAVLVSPDGPIEPAHLLLLATDAGLPPDAPGEPARVDGPGMAAPAGPLPSLAESEEALVARAVTGSGGNLSLAARRLNIAKSTLYAKLKRFGLNRDGTRAPAGHPL